MKRYFLSLLIMLPAFCYSQTMEQNVIASAGEELRGNSASITWTLGEGFIESYSTENKSLNQGFHMGKLFITIIEDEGNTGLNIKIYPNPVKDILIIESTLMEVPYKIFNVMGETVLIGFITSESERFDLAGFTSGAYFLVVDNELTHKIIIE